MSLGEAYKDVFSKVVVNEDVPAGTTGEAPLTKGGPEEEGGFRKPLVDLENMSDKDKKDNIYNIKGYSYGDGNDPVNGQEPKPTGPTYGQVAYTGNVGPEEDEEEKEEKNEEKAAQDKKKKEESEEDEEILGEHEKIARDGLNNFMSKTSVFDKLYNKVMVNENFGEDQEDITEIEALGIDVDDDGGDDGDTVTITISKALCEELHKACEEALGGGEEDLDVDVDVEEDENTFRYEEDEEAVDPGSTLNQAVNMGDGGKNKVGNLKAKGAASDKTTGGRGIDPGSTLNQTVDMGKNNKVGNLKSGQEL